MARDWFTVHEEEHILQYDLALALCRKGICGLHSQHAPCDHSKKAAEIVMEVIKERGWQPRNPIR